MMEKQISKRKLDRLTIHGGDFSQAGARRNGTFTLSHLRKLLEDDVKNLGRVSNSSAGNGSTGDARDVNDAISDEELSFILDRERVLNVPLVNEKGEESSELSGRMYDIVTSSEDMLQAIN